MWKNIVQPDRPQMAIWPMCMVCWIPKATNIHSEYIMFIAFPLQQWLHERPSMLRLHMHYLSNTCLVCLVYIIKSSIRVVRKTEYKGKLAAP
jgi:hypothetical protein